MSNTIFVALYLIVLVRGQEEYIVSNFIEIDQTRSSPLESDTYLMADKIQQYVDEKVDVKVYYESLCPGCRVFDSEILAPTIERLNQYLNINIYPYGKAQTIEKNGKYEFICQHGPEECYGNKLHACAIDVIGNITIAVMYNSCMMDLDQKNHGSDDLAADACGNKFDIDSSPIKRCAKGDRGDELLKKYGDESKKANYLFVPYILINGKESSIFAFVLDVCNAFINPPPHCVNAFYSVTSV